MNSPTSRSSEPWRWLTFANHSDEDDSIVLCTKGIVSNGLNLSRILTRHNIFYIKLSAKYKEYY